MQNQTTVHKIKRWLIIDLVLIAVAVIYYLVLLRLGQTCLIRFITGYDCPACGMTRAMLCLFNGNVRGYFAYNYLALPTAVVVYGLLHARGKAKKVFNFLAIALALLLITRFLIITY